MLSSFDFCCVSQKLQQLFQPTSVWNKHIMSRVAELTSCAWHRARCPWTCSPAKPIGERRQPSDTVVQHGVCLIAITDNVVSDILRNVIDDVTSRFPCMWLTVSHVTPWPRDANVVVIQHAVLVLNDRVLLLHQQLQPTKRYYSV